MTKPKSRLPYAGGDPPCPLPVRCAQWATWRRAFTNPYDGPRYGEPGAFVVLSAGWTQLKVTRLFWHTQYREWWIEAQYGPGEVPNAAAYKTPCRPANCFRPPNDEDAPYREALTVAPDINDNQENDDMANDLYTWKDGDKDVFGRRIAEHKGGWVMSIEGADKDVVVRDPKTINLVVPYSIRVKSMTAGNKATKHVWAREGDFAVGDLFISSRSSRLYRVMALDTASKQASYWADGVKIQGVIIKPGETTDTPPDDE